MQLSVRSWSTVSYNIYMYMYYITYNTSEFHQSQHSKHKLLCQSSTNPSFQNTSFYARVPPIPAFKMQAFMSEFHQSQLSKHKLLCQSSTNLSFHNISFYVRVPPIPAIKIQPFMPDFHQFQHQLYTLFCTNYTCSSFYAINFCTQLLAINVFVII